MDFDVLKPGEWDPSVAVSTRDDGKRHGLYVGEDNDEAVFLYVEAPFAIASVYIPVLRT